MAYQKGIDAAFDKVDFDFYEAFTQNELTYISQAMEEYAALHTSLTDEELKVEFDHILESGANSIRLLELFKRYTPTPPSQPSGEANTSLIAPNNKTLMVESAKKVLDKMQGENYQAVAANALEWLVLLSSALRELVELKKIKDSEGKTTDYEQRQPLAWKMAFDVIEFLKKDDGYFTTPPLAENQEEMWGEVEDMMSRMPAKQFHPRGIVDLLTHQFSITRKSKL